MMRGMMIRDKSLRYTLLLTLGVFLATSGYAQQAAPAARGGGRITPRH